MRHEDSQHLSMPSSFPTCTSLLPYISLLPLPFPARSLELNQALARSPWLPPLPHDMIVLQRGNYGKLLEMRTCNHKSAIINKYQHVPTSRPAWHGHGLVKKSSSTHVVLRKARHLHDLPTNLLRHCHRIRKSSVVSVAAGLLVPSIQP